MSCGQLVVGDVEISGEHALPHRPAVRFLVVARHVRTVAAGRTAAGSAVEGLAGGLFDLVPDLGITRRAGAVALVPLRWMPFQVVPEVSRFRDPVADGVVDL